MYVYMNVTRHHGFMASNQTTLHQVGNQESPLETYVKILLEVVTTW
jgi:hypothetical protein